MQTQGSEIIETPEITPKRGHLLEVLGIFTRLGLTSFGGPVAHLGYFREEIVIRRKWVDERTYGELVGLCQFLPGPASSQTGISLGIMRAGLLGGLMAWVGFTLPSAILLTLFAYWTSVLRTVIASGILHGLMVVAVAVVAQAVWGMARTHCPDRSRATIAILAAIVTLLLPAGIVQVVIIATAGLIGWYLFKNNDITTVPTSSALRSLIPRALAITCLALFTALLMLFLLPNLFYQLHALVLFASFYRSGALVFGGGHVVLPLLQAAVVLPGWVTETQFLTGYSAAQAVPGPLFTFSAYLGAIETPSPNGWVGAIIALLGIYLPSFLLLIGILPFWNSLRNQSAFQAALHGINAAVVGLLLAALYQPVWISTIKNAYDFLFALAAFGLLVIWKLPPWAIVILAALVGGLLSLL
ncbi:MAG TPA: chromate efflux transporter [Ktedonobacteraceae bacterium]